jgi:hypothetical protein
MFRSCLSYFSVDLYGIRPRILESPLDELLGFSGAEELEEPLCIIFAG